MNKFLTNLNFFLSLVNQQTPTCFSVLIKSFNFTHTFFETEDTNNESQKRIQK